MCRAFFFLKPVMPLEDDPRARWPCLTARAAGCELRVQVVPNAGRTACAGLHDGALKVRLAAPAIEGRANAALVAWLGESLGLPRRAVELIAGDTARRKRVALDCPPEQVLAWLDRQAGEAP